MEKIELSGKSRQEMDEWITAIKAVTTNDYYDSRFGVESPYAINYTGFFE